MKKKVAKKKTKQLYKCPHCDLMTDIPIAYCTVCKGHTHEMNMGTCTYTVKGISKPDDVCLDCFQGFTSQGKAWHRKNRTWKPWPWGAYWDDPEWYDGMEEWKNTTLMCLWSPDEYGIEEL